MSVLRLNIAEAVAAALADLLQPENLAGLVAASDRPARPGPAAAPMSIYDPGFDDQALIDEADAIVAGQEQLLPLINQQQAQNDQNQAMLTSLTRQFQQLTAAVRPLQPEVIHRTAPPAVQSKVRDIMAQQPLFLDLETTGLKKSLDRIIEIAITDTQGHALCHFRLNPGQPIPPAASAIHGIDDAHVAGLPTWDQVAPIIRAYLQDRLVVGFKVGDDHRKAFDSKFLPRDWGIRWVCAKDLADEAFGKYHYLDARSDWRKSGSLANRLRQCGLQPGPAHTALGDCISTLRLIRLLAGYDQTI